MSFSVYGFLKVDDEERVLNFKEEEEEIRSITEVCDDDEFAIYRL